MRRDICKLSWHVGMCHALQCSVYVFSVRGPLGHIYRQAKAVWMLLAANLLQQWLLVSFAWQHAAWPPAVHLDARQHVFQRTRPHLGSLSSFINDIN